MSDYKTIQINDYHLGALKCLFETIGAAYRAGVEGDPRHHLCNGDWGHEIYHKITHPNDVQCSQCAELKHTATFLNHWIDRLRAEVERLSKERDQALETVRELSSKVDTTAFERWVGDFENQQRAERAEAALTAAHAEITRLTNERDCLHDGLYWLLGEPDFIGRPPAEKLQDMAYEARTAETKHETMMSDAMKALRDENERIRREVLEATTLHAAQEAVRK